MHVTQREEIWKRAYADGLAEVGVAVPLALLRHYRTLQLNEQEAMLLIQLIAFVRSEHKDFPTIEELSVRMTCDKHEIAGILEKLIKQGLLGIVQNEDAATGILYERYDLQPAYAALAEAAMQERIAHAREKASEEKSARRSSGAEPGDSTANSDDPAGQAPSSAKARKLDTYSIFEREFCRPLSPMELETITGWLEQDCYKEDLILAALKEAVFTGKLNFRYIDRILLEWQRNRVQSVEQARTYSQRFRGTR